MVITINIISIAILFITAVGIESRRGRRITSEKDNGAKGHCKSQSKEIYLAGLIHLSNLGQVEEMVELLEMMEKKKIALNSHFCKIALQHLHKCGNASLQRKFFDKWFGVSNKEAPQMNLEILNTMIQGCKKEVNLDTALKYLQMIKDNGLKPNNVSYVHLLGVCASAKQVDYAEILWETIEADSRITKSEILIAAMLGVYARNGADTKMESVLKRVCKLQSTVSLACLNERTYTKVMSALLDANNPDAMFKFYFKTIPDLEKSKGTNSMDVLKVPSLIRCKCRAHVQYMRMLSPDDEHGLKFHRERFNTFFAELYPDVHVQGAAHDTDKTPSFSFKDAQLYAISILLSCPQKKWMEVASQVFELLWKSPRFERLFNRWAKDSSTTDTNHLLLDLSNFDCIVARFILRYLVVFQRDLLKKKPCVLISCHSYDDHTSLCKKADIENELNQWKVQVRLEQKTDQPHSFFLNQQDMALLFEVLPDGKDPYTPFKCTVDTTPTIYLQNKLFNDSKHQFDKELHHCIKDKKIIQNTVFF
ncbi:pentatricopeptide (PPR) repeat-containing protein [Reticulomyxa filosa]|uniref:Pentatricopeptide (PPR) repeat-containing protein n=1 Tax=Reticulomyxa filosa TaxID=46433 RepID=X6M2M9_RETFI|nr:pentatricopeptide (PPR) repeat-containing protein [Reticulomyxa filosa]|eukprot:ETO07245.1 pentatricopeptide (PPR) repeat-containing protein [Reticulomyxa filosa]